MSVQWSSEANVADLVTAWQQLSRERWATMHEAGRHGANSQARERLLRLDRALCSKLHRVGEQLRAAGVDPHSIQFEGSA